MENANNDSDILDFKLNIRKNGEKIVLEKFPKQINDLNRLLNTENFNFCDVKRAKQTENIPIPEVKRSSLSALPKFDRTGLDKRVFLFPGGLEPSNNNISEMIDIVKPLMLQFEDDMRLLKIALQLMIPKCEDGNNFGVQIQELTIRSISRAEDIIMCRYNQITKYFNHRGDMISRIAKYPHSQDFRRALQEEDEKFRLILCLMVKEIRNHYARIHDLITKNLDKIKNPRSEHDIGMC